MERSLMEFLKSETAEAHRRLEDQIDIVQLCHDRQSYENLLRDFLGFYAPLEQRLASIPGWNERGFDWEERAKVPSLHDDLKRLGLDEASIASIPRCEEIPSPSTLSQAFGCTYVLEGATLGGRQILGILEKSSIPVEARAFFHSYGEKVGIRWKEFSHMANSLDPSPEEAVEICKLASETFRSLGLWLQRNGK